MEQKETGGKEWNGHCFSCVWNDYVMFGTYDSSEMEWNKFWNGKSIPMWGNVHRVEWNVFVNDVFVKIMESQFLSKLESTWSR